MLSPFEPQPLHESSFSTESAEATDQGTLVLRVFDQPEGGYSVHHVDAPRCSLGASPTCTVTLRGQNVRPVHCVILRGRHRSAVRRWSPNSWLNGQFFNDEVICEGDELTLGGVRIQVVEDNRPLIRQTELKPGTPLPFQATKMSGLPAWQTSADADDELYARVRAAEERISQLTRELAKSHFQSAPEPEATMAVPTPQPPVAINEETDRQAILEAVEEARQAWEFEREELLAKLAHYEDHVEGWDETRVDGVLLEGCPQPTSDAAQPVITSNQQIEQQTEQRSTIGFSSSHWVAAHAELAARLQRVETEEQALSARADDLGQQEQETSVRKASLEEWADQLDQFRMELDQRSVEVEQQAQDSVTAVENIENELAALRLQMEQQQMSLADQVAGSERQQQEWADETTGWQQTVTELQQTVAALETQLAESSADAQTDERALEQVRAQVQQLQEERDQLQAALEAAVPETSPAELEAQFDQERQAWAIERESLQQELTELAARQDRQATEPAAEVFETVATAEVSDEPAESPEATVDSELGAEAPVPAEFGRATVEETGFPLSTAEEAESTPTSEGDSSTSSLESTPAPETTDPFDELVQHVEEAAAQQEASAKAEAEAEDATENTSEAENAFDLEESWTEVLGQAGEDAPELATPEEETTWADDAAAEEGLMPPQRASETQAEAEMLARLRELVAEPSADETESPTSDASGADEVTEIPWPSNEPADSPFESLSDAYEDDGSDWFDAPAGGETEKQDASSSEPSSTEPSSEEPFQPKSFIEQVQAESAELFEEAASPAESTPIPEVEATAAVSEVTVGAGEAGEDSIEDYMQQLLRRVGHGGPEPQPPVKTVEPVAEPPSVESETPVEAESKTMPPRRPKPDPIANLSAMRELANASARDAINEHEAKRYEASAFANFGITLSAVLVGAILLVFSRFQLNLLAGLGAAVEIAAIYFGFRCFSSGAGLLFQRFGKKKNEEGEGTAAAEVAPKETLPADEAPASFTPPAVTEEIVSSTPIPAAETPEPSAEPANAALFEQVSDPIDDDEIDPELDTSTDED